MILYIGDSIKDHVRNRCKHKIAAIIYLCTYTLANAKKNPDYKYSVSFCWEICGKDIHIVKKLAMLQKLGQGTDELILNSEKPYL
jgi:hypothetical protein